MKSIKRKVPVITASPNTNGCFRNIPEFNVPNIREAGLRCKTYITRKKDNSMRFIKRRVLVVTASQSNARPFRNIPGFRITTIREGGLLYHNLNAYTSVIIGSWSCEAALQRSTNKLKKFVENGGVLIGLGCQGDEAQWTPFCQWVDSQPITAIWCGTSEDFDMLFDGVDKDMLYFHEFFAHGTIDPPTSAEVLCKGDDNPVLCLINRPEKGGAALLSTIDFDFHVTRGSRRKNRKDNSERKKAARQLLENMLNWSAWRHEKQGFIKIIFRRIKGLLMLENLYILFALLLWPITLIFIYGYYYHSDNPSLWVLISGAASIAGLAIIVTEKSVEVLRSRN